MFNKIEFSDIYKFIANIGLLLIIAAFLIPVFAFQVDLIKYHKEFTVVKLSPLLERTLKYQDETIYYMFKYWWIVSILLIIIGIFMLSKGLLGWKKRQVVLDKLQDLSLEEKERLLVKASKFDIKQKITEDVEGTIEQDRNQRVYINNYKSIEMKVVDAINIKNPNINIMHNMKVGNFVYDLIIIKKVSHIKRIYKICEIKYYPKKIYYSYIHSGVSSFLLAISNYRSRIVVDDPRIQLEYYMIWVYSDNKQLLLLNLYSQKAEDFSKSKGVKLNIIIAPDNKLDDLGNQLL